MAKNLNTSIMCLQILHFVPLEQNEIINGVLGQPPPSTFTVSKKSVFSLIVILWSSLPCLFGNHHQKSVDHKH